MRVAFSAGKNSGALIENIRKHHDDIEFYSYSNVKALIKESKLRHVFFDRIIFIEKLLKHPEEDLKALNDYIVENSDSSTVILIVKDINSEASQCFERIFNSPLYTRVVLDKATSTILCDLVADNIVDIREKYFNSVVGTDKSVGVRSTNSGNTEQSAKIREEQIGSRIYTNQYENSSVGSSNTNTANMSRSSENQYGMGGSLNSEGDSFSAVINSAPVSDGSVADSGKNDSFSEDDDFLGLGNFGRSHADTGFLDEDDVPEDDGYEQPGYSDRSYEVMEEPVKKEKPADQEVPEGLDMSRMTKVILVTGERGTGVTTTIVDSVYHLYKKGESVLIIDADYVRNGILSFIDAEDFYAKGNEDGIDTLNPYVEEECDIISNGYGSQLSKSSISNVVSNSDIQSNYDRIVIDCPLDCLNVITERVVRGNTVLVLTKGDRGALVSTSIGLTDRLMVEVSLERYIMTSCEVAVSGYTDEFKNDVKFIKNTFLFPNGCWLDNIK